MRIYPLLIATVTFAMAAETPQALPTAPESQRPGAVAPRGNMSVPSLMPRALMAYEVEMLVMSQSDKAALARWAELGAAGYRVVQATSDAGQTILFLERPLAIVPGGGVRLPSAIDGETATILSARMADILGERQRILQQNKPPAGPVEGPK